MSEPTEGPMIEGPPDLESFHAFAHDALIAALPYLLKGKTFPLSVELWSCDMNGNAEGYGDGEEDGSWPLFRVELDSVALLTERNELKAWEVVKALADELGLGLLREGRRTEVVVGTGRPLPFQRWAEFGHKLAHPPYTAALEGRIVVFPSAVDQCWEVLETEPVGLDLRRITGAHGDWRWLWTPDPACEYPIVLRTPAWAGETLGPWNPADPYADHDTDDADADDDTDDETSEEDA